MTGLLPWMCGFYSSRFVVLNIINQWLSDFWSIEFCKHSGDTQYLPTPSNYPNGMTIWVWYHRQEWIMGWWPDVILEAPLTFHPLVDLGECCGVAILLWSKFLGLHPFPSDVEKCQIWLTKSHSNWQKIDSSATYFMFELTSFFKISLTDWHVQKDFKISAVSGLNDGQ